MLIFVDAKQEFYAQYLNTFALPFDWQAPFERSFGLSFDHVRILYGRDVDRLLSIAGDLAQAINRKTILLSTNVLNLPHHMRLFIVGHELAHVSQLARGGSDKQEYLEEEAWAAAWTALRGKRYRVTGGAAGKPLSAYALVTLREAFNYYHRFREQRSPKGNLRITAQTMMIRPTFETLLNQIIRTPQRDIIVVAHGYGNGLTMKFTANTNRAADRTCLELLKNFATVETQLSQLISSNKLARWQRILRIILPRQQHKNIARWNTVALVKREVNKWLTWAANQLITARNLNFTAKRNIVNRIIRSMRRVQQRRINRLHFINCTMGGNLATLNTFRSFFGAGSVCAPRVSSYFGTFMPGGPGYINGIINSNPRARILTMPSGRFVVSVSPTLGLNFNSRSAADNNASLNEWINSYAMRGNWPFTIHQALPTHFLQIPPIFPLENRYMANIGCSP